MNRLTIVHTTNAILYAKHKKYKQLTELKEFKMYPVISIAKINDLRRQCVFLRIDYKHAKNRINM